MEGKKQMTGRHEVRRIFERIAGRYDFLNGFFSFSIHRYWNKALARTPGLKQVCTALDVCAGTGDAGIRWAVDHPACRIVGLDISAAMLRHSRRKIQHRNLSRRFTLCLADALHMPFADGRFDAVLNAFGLRNEHHLIQAVGEMARVLKPGGTIHLLEFSLPQNRVLKRIYLFYLTVIMPAVSRIFLRDRSAFDYLARTVRSFPPPDQITAVMRACRFADVTATPLTGGIVCVYRGQYEGAERSHPS